jgi:hypothetical protein
MYYALRIAAVLVLAAASLLSLAISRADFYFRAGTPEAVAKAVELAPGNAGYLEMRALQLDYDGADSRPLLKRAAALDPMSSAPRIRLGIAAETRGDFAGAEKWLLDAARVDHEYEPRWTLANFYFRRADAARFWTWMRSALEISYGDRRPAFDLCWRMSDDAAEIFARAIPGSHDVLAAYLSYVEETNRAEAVAPVALNLAAGHNSEDRDLLLGAVDALIAAKSATQAWQLWQAMGFGGVSFQSPRVGRGFDWQRVDVPGVVQLEIDQPRAMHRVSFNGSEPESCELLRRVFKLEPGRRYELRWQAEPDVAGVDWRIAGERASLKAGEITFVAPAELVPLTLVYQRPQGEVRAEGSLELWNVDVQPK